MQDVASNLQAVDPDDIRSMLGDGEFVLATFSPNLNQELCFERGTVALTSRRIVHRRGNGTENSTDVVETMQLHSSELAGVQKLELHESGICKAVWYSTLSQAPAIHNFVEAFESLKRGYSRPGIDTNWIEKADQSSSRAWTRSLFRSPLLRLLKFTRARIKAIMLGLVLTFVATAVGLIPPYMTMPLVQRSPCPNAGPSKRLCQRQL